MKRLLVEKAPLVIGTILSILVIFILIYSTSTNKTDDIVVIYDSSRNATNVSGEEKKYKVYLITMNMLDDFWKSMDTGCRQAVNKLGNVDYKWIGPDVHEDDLQAICIDQAVEEGADAILLASSSPTGVNESLKKADEAGVKIIYVDNAATYDGVAFLSTDNKLAGEIAAETMQQALSEAGITSGKIGIMTNKITTISTNLRGEGFREKFKGTAFTVTDTFYMEDDPQRIGDFIKNNMDYVAFFGSNEMTTVALGKYMKEMDPKKIIVGFDTSDAVLALVYDGIVYAVMQQNPELMGSRGVEIAIKALEGTYNEEKNTKVDTGINVIKKDTM